MHLAELDTLLAARPTILTALAVLRFDTLAIRTVVVVVVDVSMLRTLFFGFRVIRINFRHDRCLPAG